MRQIILVDMAFNLGFVRLNGGVDANGDEHIGFRKLHAALVDKDYPLASSEILDSTYAGQVGPRANRNAASMESDQISPHYEIKMPAIDHKQVLSALAINNNGSNKPILPDLAKKQSSEEIRQLAEKAVAGNSAVKNRAEARKLVRSDGKEEDSCARYASTMMAIAYSKELKSYGLGLSERIKESEEYLAKMQALHGPDSEHNDLVDAEARLNQAVDEHKLLLKVIDNAGMIGEFALGMVSAIGKITGNASISKIAFYGSAVLNMGLSIAKLYSGNPMGALGLASSISSLFGGAPQPSPEQLMLKQVIGMLQDIQKDIRVVQRMINQLSKQMRLVHEDVINIRYSLRIVAGLSLTILNEIQDIKIQLMQNDYLHYLITVENRRIYTGFAKWKRVIELEERLSSSDIVEVHRTWNLYIHVLSRLKSVLSANETLDWNRLAYLIDQRSQLEMHSQNRAYGLLHNLDFLLRVAQARLQNKVVFERVYPVRGGRDRYLICNLPMWEDGVRVRLRYFQILLYQNKVGELIRTVGMHGLVNALQEDIVMATHTLEQLNKLSQSKFLTSMGEYINHFYKEVFNVFFNFEYLKRSDLRVFRNNALKRRQQMFTKEDYNPTNNQSIPRAVEQFWNPKRLKLPSIGVQGMNGSVPYTIDDIHAKGGVIVYHFGNISGPENREKRVHYVGAAGIEKTTKVRVDGITAKGYIGGMPYPSKITFYLRFGEDKYDSWEVIDSGRPDGELRYGWVRKPCGVKRDLTPTVWWVPAAVYDQKLYELSSDPVVKYIESRENRGQIIRAVRGYEGSLQKVQSMITLVRGYIRLMTRNSIEQAKVVPALDKFLATSGDMLEFLGREGFTLDMDWQNPKLNFQPAKRHLTAVTSNLKKALVELESQIHSVTFMDTPLAKRIQSLVTQLRMTKAQVLAQNLGENASPAELAKLTKMLDSNVTAREEDMYIRDSMASEDVRLSTSASSLTATRRAILAHRGRELFHEAEEGLPLADMSL